MKRKKGDGSVFQRGAVWWIKYYRNGKPYRETSGSEKESEARKLLKKRLGEIALGRFIGPEAERVTVRELATDYLNDYRINGRKSLDKAERMVKRYDDDGNEIDSELMAYFGDCKAHSVGTDGVKAYTAKRIEEGAANATLNRELAALKRMFNLGIQAEKIHRKPYIPLRVLWPLIIIATRSWTPARTMFLTAVRRKSWSILVVSPVALRASFQASR